MFLNPKNKLSFWLILAALASAVVFGWWVSSDKRYSEGSRVPKFTVQLANGRLATVNLDFKGDSILHFWATWCAPCVEELPGLDQYIAKSKENVRVMPISMDGTKHENRVKAFLKEHNLSNIKPHIGQFVKLRDRLDLHSLPVTIVVKDGVVVERIDGPVDWDDFEID